MHRVTLVQAASELARSAMAERGLAPLSSLGGEAVAARIAQQALAQGELAYFHPVAALPGFSRALARTLRDLRLAGAQIATLAGAGAPAADLARLLERYQAELDERSLVDLPGLLALATEAALSGRHPWVGLPLVGLDADLETRAHKTFFSSLAARAPEVLEAVLGEDSGGEPAHSLEHLRQYLFVPEPRRFARQDGRFEFFSAPGEGLEAVEIARRIMRLAREGLVFDQVAILLRNPDRYQPMIEDALARAGIPAWFSRGTARPHPSGRAFLALLLCAGERLSASRFAEYLSLGQVPEHPVPPRWVASEDEILGPSESEESKPAAEADRPTPWRWERLLVEASVIEGGKRRWERRLNGLEAEFTLQEKPLDQIQNLKELALPVIGMLEALPDSAIWSVWLDQLAELARFSLRDPDPVLSVLAELAPMGDVGPVALEEVAQVLSERLRFLRREPPSQRWGRVFVGSIDEARGREFGIVFLPGLAEGLFPQRVLEDPLLLDDLREAISADLPLRKQRVNDERMRLHLAVAAARDRLIASYPRMEVAEGRPRVPSFYALELPRAIEGSLPELKAFEDRAREAASARLNWPAPKDPAEAIDDAEYDLVSIAGASGPGAVHYLVETNPHVTRSLRARWTRWHGSWKPADGLVTEDPAALEALQTQRLTTRPWSPSSLEHFAMCPYKFALHGIYRLAPRDVSEPLEHMDPRTRGALFHEIQFELFQDLQRAELLPVSEDRLPEALKRADAMLDRVAEKYQEKLAPAIPRVWKSEIEDLRTDLRGWLQHVARNDDDWEPVKFELAFGDPPIALAEGVNLRGRIDLVEKGVGRDVYRVTDHKTGKRPDPIPRWVGGGRSLQPLLYALAAERLLGSPVESGRLLYATQRGGYTPVEIKVDDRSRLFLQKLLADIDASIAGGFLPPAPAKDACQICDYRIVCGPYEERRLGRKDRHDERLEPLTGIRGMA